MRAFSRKCRVHPMFGKQRSKNAPLLKAEPLKKVGKVLMKALHSTISKFKRVQMLVGCS